MKSRTAWKIKVIKGNGEFSVFSAMSAEKAKVEGERFLLNPEVAEVRIAPMDAAVSGVTCRKTQSGRFGPWENLGHQGRFGAF
jgi:hypothetical protein